MVKMRRARRRGAQHHRATLTDHDVTLMRELYYCVGLCVREIADKFEVSKSTAFDAVVGDHWPHVPMPVCELVEKRPPIVRKLTEQDVIEMRRLHYIEGVSCPVIAVQFGVTTSAAFKAVTGRRWAHVPFPVRLNPDES